MSQRKTWFITGASRGFGRVWTEAALERGDKIVTTARKPEALADLVGRYGDAILALALDVTDAAAVSSAVQRGFEHFGRLDIVVSNAGYGQIGMIEEIEIEAVRRNFETNFFGTLSVIKAVLPLLRAQGSGHIYYGPDGFAEGKGYPTAAPIPKSALDETVAKRLWLESERLTCVKFGALSDVP